MPTVVDIGTLIERSHLTLAQVHAALAYYYANRDEIDDDIAAEEAVVDEIFPTAAKRT
jgi:hypothetical protein